MVSCFRRLSTVCHVMMQRIMNITTLKQIQVSDYLIYYGTMHHTFYQFLDSAYVVY